MLTDFLAERRRHLDAAARAVRDECFVQPDFLNDVEEQLLERFRLDEVALGDTSIDEDVGQERVSTTDPRVLRPGETSRVITVDVYVVMIPVGGGTELLSYWPPDVKAIEPDERAWLDPRVPCIRIPARAEPDDKSGRTTGQFLMEQERNIRVLVAATNVAVRAWNADLPDRVRDLLERQRSRYEARTSVRSNLGFPVASPTPKPIPHHLPRETRSPRSPLQLEGGDYPLLGEEDLAEVVRAIRRWADFAAENLSTVAGKDESALRDLLLHSLNAKWAGTAETFSKLGRTDIRLVVATAAATGVSDLLFKAECKKWRHAGSATEAFVQLTTRYLTNRETRAALIFFVSNPKDLRKARDRAVERLVQRHGASISGELSGWPLLDVPHPEHPDRTIHLVVAIVDTTGGQMATRR